MERVGITTATLRTWTKYSVKKMYKTMKGEAEKVQWSRNVWERWSIPKHSFSSWLAIQDKLKTKARLVKYGYSQNVLKLITTWLGSVRTHQDLESAFKWINRRMSKHKVKKKVWNAAVNAVVYSIWQVRNSIVWRNQMQQEVQTAKQIMFLILSRLNKIRGRRMKPNDEEWIDSLYNYCV
ncbi:tRNA-2-methylthio-N(6)-dimethylallyladenosine synthase [Bienertia sinuspersici]